MQEIPNKKTTSDVLASLVVIVIILPRLSLVLSIAYWCYNRPINYYYSPLKIDNVPTLF